MEEEKGRGEGGGGGEWRKGRGGGWRKRRGAVEWERGREDRYMSGESRFVCVCSR